MFQHMISNVSFHCISLYFTTIKYDMRCGKKLRHPNTYLLRSKTLLVTSNLKDKEF